MNKPINLTCIVDDDPIYTFVIKRLLKKNNFSEEYLIYKNGKEAINGIKNRVQSKKTLPDVILLDINMPVMDGWDFLDVYKEINFNKTIPLYITSSSINKIDLDRANNNANVRKYIEKPLNNKSLELIKKEVLEKPL